MFQPIVRSNTIRSLAVAIVLTFTVIESVRAVEEVQDIANPRSSSQWVVDLTGTIEQSDLDRINEFCESIHRSGGSEMAVVMIHTTADKSVEDFALELFNLWGIGRASENDGLLFLVAKDDRRMRIALGDGIDGDLEEQIARQILDEEVTPRFKAREFGEGLYAGTFSTAIRILNLAENEAVVEAEQPAAVAAALKPLAQPPAAVAGRPGTDIQMKNRAHDNPRRGASNLPFWIGGGLLGLGGLLFVGGRYWLRFRSRHCERCQTEMVLLEEDQDDQYLDSPEQTEERIGSVNYDVWACRACEHVEKIRFGKFFTRYSRCPDCNYITKFKVKNTVVAATTVHGGQVHVEERCVNCPFYHDSVYSTPKLTPPSSSRSFGSGGFSGGGSSSSFGGGSSSGGGASGGW